MKSTYKQSRNNSGCSGYSNHILNTGHAHGSIINTTKVIRINKMGKHLNTLEKYHIHKTSKNGLHMNDANTDAYNRIFETLQEINTR